MTKNKELVGWETCFGQVVGMKIFEIVERDEKYIYAIYRDIRGYHKLKFSAKTGKQWRTKPWETTYILTQQGIKR